MSYNEFQYKNDAKQAHNELQIMIARISIGLGTISVVKNKIK